MNHLTEQNTIRIGETDAHHRLTVPALTERLQDIAWEHSVTRAVDVPRLLEQGVSWVLSRMRIDVTRWPTYREAVALMTWVADIDRYFYYRPFRLTDAETGDVLIRATSVWGVLDMEKRRVVPIPAFIRSKTAVFDGPEALPPASGKLPPPDEVQYAESFTARWYDLDANGHVNNTRYFQWLLDALPDSFLDSHTLQTLDVVFRGEAMLGQPVVSEAAQPEPLAFAHRIRTDDGRELVQARSVWVSSP